MLQRVANQQFLYDRRGAYYFRRAVPSDARQAFGGVGEIVVSLKTRNLREARHRLQRELDAYEVRLSEARGSAGINLPHEPSQFVPERSDMERGVRSWLAGQLASFQPGFGDQPGRDAEAIAADLKRVEGYVAGALKSRRIPLTTGWIAETLCQREGWRVEPGSPEWAALCTLVAEGELELSRQAVPVSRLEYPEPRNKALFSRALYDRDQEVARVPRLTLRAAVPLFLADPALGANEKTREKYRGHLETLIEALGRDRKLASITKQDCRQLRDEVICRLPPHRSIRFVGMSVRAAVAAAEKAGTEPIHPRTQTLMIDNLQALFEWAVQHEHRPDNPAKGLRVAAARGTDRRPYTPEQLKVIFSAPIYTGCVDDLNGFARPGPNHPRNHRFWVPLIALFTGMRLNEICQLRGNDLREQDGVWAIHVTEDKAAGKKVKTKSSLRRVPVHPELKLIGLPALARARGDEWLFPELDREGQSQGSEAVSKWWNRSFLKSVKLDGKDVVFHSFRHTFRDALREAGIDMERSLALGGWTDTTVGNRYGGGFSLSALAEAMARIRHPGLNLTHLHQPEEEDA